MEAHIHEWLNLLLRWIHFIVGVAWIGASFYFNWLENNLDRKPPQEEGIAGNLWAVHGGGFYHLKKFSTGPNTLPSTLHWFKWEAYTTFLSGFSLLVIVYYFNARAFLLDPSVSDISISTGIAIGTGSLLGSWLVYDGLCRSPLKNKPLLLGVVILGWFSILAWFLSEFLSGRAAFIHVGAAVGTVMVANVFFVIIPAQKEMVSALSDNRALDPEFGKAGLLRSRHNNYLTLPVLFTMISSHFPSTYTHSLNWVILLLIAVFGIVARHYFNVRHLKRNSFWLLPLAFVGLVGVMLWTAPERIDIENSESRISSEQITALINERCTSCHAESPTQPGFSGPPKGIVIESHEQILTNRDTIFQTTVINKIMPLGNLTGITDKERSLIAQWYEETR